MFVQPFFQFIIHLCFLSFEQIGTQVIPFTLNPDVTIDSLSVARSGNIVVVNGAVVVPNLNAWAGQEIALFNTPLNLYQNAQAPIAKTGGGHDGSAYVYMNNQRIALQNWSSSQFAGGGITFTLVGILNN